MFVERFEKKKNTPILCLSLACSSEACCKRPEMPERLDKRSGSNKAPPCCSRAMRLERLIEAELAAEVGAAAAALLLPSTAAGPLPDCALLASEATDSVRPLVCAVGWCICCEGGT